MAASSLASSLSQARTWLRAAQRIALLTGAGVSAESGVPTFRDAQSGLWANFRPEELATEAAFRDMHFSEGDEQHPDDAQPEAAQHEAEPDAREQGPGERGERRPSALRGEPSDQDPGRGEQGDRPATGHVRAIASARPMAVTTARALC